MDVRKGENSTALEHSKRKSALVKDFSFITGGYEVSVCLQKNKAAGKGYTQREGRKIERRLF